MSTKSFPTFDGLSSLPVHEAGAAPQIGETSIGRFYERFFAVLAKNPFTYEGETYTPKGVAMSAHTFRRTFNCLPDCGACCWARISLSYLPWEHIPEAAQPYMKEISFEVNGKQITVLDDNVMTETSVRTGKCKHMNMSTGRCGIHPKAIGEGNGNYPAVCEVFPLKISMFTNPERPNRLASGHISRAWLSTQIDGTKGVKCYYSDDYSEDQRLTQLSGLQRLLDWANHSGIDTWIPEVMQWIRDDFPQPYLTLGFEKPETVIASVNL